MSEIEMERRGFNWPMVGVFVAGPLIWAGIFYLLAEVL